jgi:hypothetical protein
MKRKMSKRIRTNFEDILVELDFRMHRGEDLPLLAGLENVEQIGNQGIHSKQSRPPMHALQHNST